jgi:hypothetical protein
MNFLLCFREPYLLIQMVSGFRQICARSTGLCEQDMYVPRHVVIVAMVVVVFVLLTRGWVEFCNSAYPGSKLLSWEWTEATFPL